MRSGMPRSFEKADACPRFAGDEVMRPVGTESSESGREILACEEGRVSWGVAKSRDFDP